MSSWVPSTDFEEEIVSLQPDHNFIYGSLLSQTQSEECHPRPQSHLEYAEKQKNNTLKSTQSQKLKVIAKVQNISRSKPLGEQPTLQDWDNNDNIEKETVAMMRHFGLGPSTDAAINENCTLPTLPINKDVQIMCNGKKSFPIFFDEKFFKLQPRDDCRSNHFEDTNSADSSSTSSTNLSLYPAESGSNNQCGGSTTELKSNSNCFEGIIDESIKTNHDEDSYCTAYSGNDFIPTSLWYSSKKRSDNLDNSNGSSNSSLTASSSQNGSQGAKKKKQYYTTKELYDRKRYN